MNLIYTHNNKKAGKKMYDICKEKQIANINLTFNSSGELVFEDDSIYVGKDNINNLVGLKWNVAYIDIDTTEFEKDIIMSYKNIHQFRWELF